MGMKIISNQNLNNNGYGFADYLMAYLVLLLLRNRFGCAVSGLLRYSRGTCLSATEGDA